MRLYTSNPLILNLHLILISWDSSPNLKKASVRTSLMILINIINAIMIKFLKKLIYNSSNTIKLLFGKPAQNQYFIILKNVGLKLFSNCSQNPHIILVSILARMILKSNFNYFPSKFRRFYLENSADFDLFFVHSELYSIQNSSGIFLWFGSKL